MVKGMPKFLLVCFLAGFLFSPKPVPAQEEICDPLEPMNRGISWFNDKADIYFVEPIAKGYDAVVPNLAQEGIRNFFSNLRYPIYLLSDVVQLKFGQASQHTGRFLINTTAGVAGIFDVAQYVGLKHQETDFGVALASQGVPAGPYLVLPFLGPSNVRDGIGRLVDSAIHPLAILEYSDVRAGISDPIVYGSLALDMVQTRADLLEAIKAAKESSLDYYLFTQSAYYQYREGLVKGTRGGKNDNEFEEEDEFAD